MQRPKILTPEEEKTLESRLASAGCAQAPGSAALRGELMVLVCGVEECSRGLKNLSAQLDNISGHLEAIVDRLKPNTKVSGGKNPPKA